MHRSEEWHRSLTTQQGSRAREYLSLRLTRNSFPRIYPGYFGTSRRSLSRAIWLTTLFGGDESLWCPFSRNTRKTSSFQSTYFRVVRIFYKQKSLKKMVFYIGFCRELISLSFETNWASNGPVVAEKNQKYWAEPIFAKKRAFFTVIVSVWPTAQQRLNQKLWDFYHKLSRSYPIEWQENERNLVFFVWAKRSWSRGLTLKDSVFRAENRYHGYFSYLRHQKWSSQRTAKDFESAINYTHCEKFDVQLPEVFQSVLLVQ